MKKTNRFIALLTALVLVFSTMINTVAFAAVNPDVTGTDYEVAVGKLKALGIMEGYPDGSFKPEGEITRAEFAKIAVTAMGLGDAAEASKGMTKFGDVTASHWASGYINLAVNRGLVAGYPDGTYKPEGKLTNAEAITILCRLVGLGPVIDKEGTWPANYIGRASNEGILKGVNVASGTGALRGLVAKMLANTLEVDIWGAGTYKNDGTVEYSKLGLGKNLLTEKLDIKIKDDKVVTDVAELTASGLNDGEIKLAAETFTNKTEYTAEYLLGLEVDAWVNEDDEIIFIDIETAASDIKFDTVTAVNADDEYELLVADDSFEQVGSVADGADLWINYAAANDADINAATNTLYGKMVMNNGKVESAFLFEFDKIDAGLVEKVDGSEVSYWDVADEETLEFEDYDDDEVFVFGPKLVKAAVADVKADSVIYAFENADDELFLLTAGEVKTGKLDKVAAAEAKVAGTVYDTTAMSTVSINNNDDLEAYDYTDATTKDLVGEEVKATLDLNGDVRHIVGDAEATSGTLYGLAVDAYANGKYNTIEIFNAEGKTVEYNFEEKADGVDIVGYFAGGGVNYVAVAYEVNKDGEIAELTLEASRKDDVALVDAGGTVTAVITDGNAFNGGAITEFNEDNDRIEIDADDNGSLADIADGIYYFDNDTVFMSSADDDDEEVLTWDKIKGDTGNIDLLVVGTEGKAADFVWIYAGYTALADDEVVGLITEDPFWNGDDYVYTVDVAGQGIKELVYANNTTYFKGDIIRFKISSSDEISNVAATSSIAGGYTTELQVIDKDGSFWEMSDGTVYKIDADAVVYLTKTNNTKIDKKTSKASIAEGDNVAIGVDADGIVQVIVELDKDTVAPIVTNVASPNTTTIVLTFSEALAPAKVINANFDAGTTTSESVALSADGKTVTITVDTLVGAETVTVEAAVTDVAGNAITQVTFTRGVDF